MLRRDPDSSAARPRPGDDATGLRRRLAQAEARVRELEAALEAARSHEAVPLGSEDLLDRVLDRLPGNVVRRVLYPDGRVVYPFVSQGLYDTFGIEPRDIMEQKDASFNWIHPEDRAAWVAALRRSAERLAPLDHENRVVAPDGRVSWVRSIAKPRRGAEGEIIWDGIALDVTDRKFAEAEMRAAKEEAEHANQAKSKFLAAASHDLRQPLQSMRFLMAALAREEHGEKAGTMMANVELCLDALDGLLDALLDISKLDAGVITPRPSNLCLGDLFARLAQEFAPQLAEKDLELRVVSTNLVVRSDPTLLETLLRNLLSNAIKYTPEGRILIGCRGRAGRTRIEVIDEGIGIAEEQQREIFEPFHQVANAARDRNLGLGLGLAIVERVAKLLDHPIGLRSSPGRGSAFWVEVPVVDEAPPQQAAQGVAPEIAYDALIGTKVLLIEDDLAVAESLRGLLAVWGCQVSLAVDAEGAKRYAGGDAAVPEIVIADFRLPNGATGVQAIADLRARAGRAIPAIVLTGDTEPESIREAEAGGDRLLHKPVRPAKLRALMSYLLSDAKTEATG